MLFLGGRPLRVGIDGRNLQAAAGTGIATYAANLARAVRDMGAQSELLVARDASRGRARRWSAAFTARLGGLPSALGLSADPLIDRVRLVPDGFRCAQVHFDMWRRLLPVGGHDLPDVMHWTAPLPLRLIGVPNIYTFHDVIPLRTPNLSDTRAARYRRLLRTIAASADHVLTVSEASAREIGAVLPELSGRLSVIPQVVELPARVLALSPAALDAVARETVGCGAGEFYLFCGTIEPRKNIPALIRAFRASGSTRRLVLAGPDGAHAAEEVDPLLGPDVVRVGYLERERLLTLMRAARALLYPSLEEGFGLPIIEAMGLGTPVLTSRGGATEEVAGGAAVLVDPTDLAELTEAIMELDADAAHLTEQGRLGRLRSSRFSRVTYAEHLMRLYNRVCASAAPA